MNPVIKDKHSFRYGGREEGVFRLKGIPLAVANFPLMSMSSDSGVQRMSLLYCFFFFLVSYVFWDGWKKKKKRDGTSWNPSRLQFFLPPFLVINGLNDGNQSRKRRIYSPILILLGIDWEVRSITAINAFWGSVLSCLPLKTSRSSFISTDLLHL